MTDAWELIAAARINLESVAKMNPVLRQHPIWQIAMKQLEEAEKALIGGDDA